MNDTEMEKTYKDVALKTGMDIMNATKHDMAASIAIATVVLGGLVYSVTDGGVDIEESVHKLICDALDAHLAKKKKK